MEQKRLHMTPYNRTRSNRIIRTTTLLLLSTLFLYAASMKIFLSANALHQMWPWTASQPALVTFTACTDILLVIGLITTAFFRIPRTLPLITFGGILIQMIAAIILHFSRHEAAFTGINWVIALIVIVLIRNHLKRRSKN